jgi:arsenate reductase (thioredoxin)
VSSKGGNGKSILFVCIENSSRSIMGEAFAKGIGLAASSAGTFPATHVNPLVVEAMNEVGIDVSGSRPKELTEKMIDHADVVVLTDASLGTAIPGKLRKKMRKKVVEWFLPDPQGKDLEEIRSVRDQIRLMMQAFANAPGRQRG